MLIKTLKITLLSTLLFHNSCMHMAAGGAMASSTVVLKDKSIGDSIDDFTIKTKLSNNFFQKDIKLLFKPINIKVSQGRVLFTGEVDSQETRMLAVRMAWKIRGVKEVINELEINQAQKINFKQLALDGWITTQLKTKLLLHNRVRSLNYNIETIKATIYLMGVTHSEEELRIVTNIASEIKHVAKVVSYVKVQLLENANDLIVAKQLPIKEKQNFNKDKITEVTEDNKQYPNFDMKAMRKAKPAPVEIIDDDLEEFDDF